MSTFEWFLLIIVVIVVPLTVAAVVTLWTIDQANKRKRANRKDAQIGVKRKAALSPEEVAARKAARAERQQAAAATTDTSPIAQNDSPEFGNEADSPTEFDASSVSTPDTPDTGGDSSSSDSGSSDGGGDGGGGDS